MFQEGALFDSMTVADNVAYCLREEHVDEEEIEPRVRESLRFVEMEDTMENCPSELSGGMRRRVSIARALVSRPEVVLYDSPTAGLDPVTSQTIITLILRLRDTQGVTSVLATHRLQDAFGLANYRFDGKTGHVVHIPHNGNSQALPAATNFVVLRAEKYILREVRRRSRIRAMSICGDFCCKSVRTSSTEFAEEALRWRNTNN